MNPCLIVTVDTEEEGLWGGEYRRTGNSVENIRGVERFQSLCDRFGIRPTYLVDAPVVQDDFAVDTLGHIQADGRAEIGAHLHPWCTPPFTDALDERSSYMCNLPAALQRDMLFWLTETIEKRFGHRPTSFRAGRYGFDILGARILRELGYRVDSSVIPFTDYSTSGGPNFETAPHTPYFVGSDDLCTPSESGDLLEVPVSVGFNRSDFGRSQSIFEATRHPLLRRIRSEGFLDRTGLLRRIKFSPEQANARRMTQLVDAYLAGHAPALVMMFHSSSLLPGCSPYVQTDDDLEQFYGDLEETFEYCLTGLGIVNRTLSGYAALFASSLQTVTA